MLKRFVSLFGSLGRYQLRAVLATCDLIILNFSVWLAMIARWGHLDWAQNWRTVLLMTLAPAAGVAGFFFVRLYRHVTRHFDWEGDKLIFLCVSLSSLLLGLGAFLLNEHDIPRSVIFLYPLFGTLLVSGTRRLMRLALTGSGHSLPPNAAPRDIRNIAIYGVNDATSALIRSVRRSHDLEVVGLVDPNPELWRQFVSGIRIHAPEQLPKIIARFDIRHILLATQNVSRSDRLKLLSLANSSRIDVRVLPPVEDIALGRVTVNNLRNVEALDLLGRAPIPPQPELMAHSIRDRCVMVTGAGGSIGSELVRQILLQKPKRLVMLDASEANLYFVQSEIASILQKNTDLHRLEIVAILGSVTDEALVKRSIGANKVETLYHAAAFKHVPILETNALVGVWNNAIGTEILVAAAESSGVETFVLVSTDKAVRPSSVMGASKRVAEMLVQAHAARSTATTFCIVRFGNVLDSSGSVVRLFRRQIAAGGPLTITHPDVVRYFISIPEAASLVIQAGAMAKGGEVFALDMGEPLKIVDLANMMIRLSGLQPRNRENPDGDIEMTFVGLRPGEKLFEELYLSTTLQGTAHPRIHSVSEPFIDADKLRTYLRDVKTALANGEPNVLQEILEKLVEGYQRKP